MSQGEKARYEKEAVKPNKADAPDAAMPAWLQSECQHRRVGDLRRDMAE